MTVQLAPGKPRRLRRPAKSGDSPAAPTMTARQMLPTLHPNEAAAGGGALVATPSLTTLLTRSVLQDGEVILLLLKPSAWFVLFSSLRFIAAVLLLIILATLLGPRLPGPSSTYVEAGLLLIAGRLMWGILQWMSRLYILTDLRVIRLAGIFNVDVFECPLRKVERTRLLRPVRERLLALGSIEILPQSAAAGAVWQTIRRPIEIHEQVVAAINRAKHSGRGCPPGH